MKEPDAPCIGDTVEPTTFPDAAMATLFPEKNDTCHDHDPISVGAK